MIKIKLVSFIFVVFSVLFLVGLVSAFQIASDVVSVNSSGTDTISCQNFPPPSFCPEGINDVIVTGTDNNGCSIYGCKSNTTNMQKSCENFPGPSFCPGGTEYIIVTGTDNNGCSIYGCKLFIIEHYIVIDDEYSSNDMIIANSLQTYLVKLFETDNMSFSIKYRSNISKKDLDGRVTTFIYDNKALIINNEVSYGLIIKNDPFLKGNPAITEYLSYRTGILAIPRNSSEVIYDDLRKELFKDCKNLGEYWQTSQYNRYNICCQGLNHSFFAKVTNESCGFDTEHIVCSDCGNGICESWENICNCKEDCEISKDSQGIVNEMLNNEEINVITSENLSLIGSKIMMQTSSNSSKEINFMPEELYDILMLDSIENVELNEESENAVYSVIGTKKAKVLMVFPADMKVEAKVSAETGEIISMEKPWWGFLAKEE